MLLLLPIAVNALLALAPLQARPLLACRAAGRRNPEGMHRWHAGRMTAMDPEAEALPDAPIPGLTTVSANEHGPSGAVPAADECPPEDVTALELLRFTLPVLTAALSAEIMPVVDTAVVGVRQELLSISWVSGW